MDAFTIAVSKRVLTSLTLASAFQAKGWYQRRAVQSVFRPIKSSRSMCRECDRFQLISQRENDKRAGAVTFWPLCFVFRFRNNPVPISLQTCATSEGQKNKPPPHENYRG